MRSGAATASQTIATYLLWHWFRGTDTTADHGEVIAPIPIEAPTLLEHA